MFNKIMIALFLAVPGLVSGYLLIYPYGIGIFLWFFGSIISSFIINVLCFTKKESIERGFIFIFFNWLGIFLGIAPYVYYAPTGLNDKLFVILFGVSSAIFSVGIYVAAFFCVFTKEYRDKENKWGIVNRYNIHKSKTKIYILSSNNRFVQ